MRIFEPTWPRSLLGALLAGAALWFGVGLAPGGIYAWLAPIPLLWLAFSIEAPARARVAVLLATLLATSHYLGYFRLVMPLPVAIVAILAIALLWSAVVLATRRIVRGLGNGWSVLAYPSLWVGVDLLMARLLPDGNWGSPAYAQADVLPLLQTASLVGMAGPLFLQCLVPSLTALLLWSGHKLGHPVRWLAATAIVLVAALGFGSWRLATHSIGTPVRIGLASIDDPIGPEATPHHWGPIRARYDQMVTALAAQNARWILLPEKIATLPPQELPAWQAHFSELARRNRVWLVVGIAEQSATPHNYAWWFDPEGRRLANYQKHFMAPPERAEHYAAGTAYAVDSISGLRWGLAICKDMQFARLGRANGLRDAAAMLVPAWDFGYRDAWLSERIAASRGVENGYWLVRSAREGLLSISDPQGRILLKANSAPMPGSMAIATVSITPIQPTLFTRIGDAFGWLCLALSAALLVLARGSRQAGASPNRG
ncbi:nitrilase-related carbon-nitrogen hydrolase [Enterobacter sp.]|uniref:nitrilase-related carbon-nitrogen hydrolase n=1 Tax=Enterobacter sp. TaxID=42895 RepID=UPI003D152878